ncbi:hypothetical protein D3C81_1590850 [compost metagenome]
MMPSSSTRGTASRTYGQNAFILPSVTFSVPSEAIGDRLRVPLQSIRPPFGPLATNVMSALSSGRVLRFFSSRFMLS